MPTECLTDRSICVLCRYKLLPALFGNTVVVDTIKDAERLEEAMQGDPRWYGKVAFGVRHTVG